MTFLNNEYMIPIWAEENAALAATTYEWAYGNGANTPADGGITIYVPSGWACEIVAMSLRLGGGTATVELVHNGTPKGSDAQVVVSSGQSVTDELTTPLVISNNDYINFRTLAAAGTMAPIVVTAWLRYWRVGESINEEQVRKIINEEVEALIKSVSHACPAFDVILKKARKNQ